jgi:hypothetical protein
MENTGNLSGGETFRVDKGELITLGDDETDGEAFYAMMKDAVAGQLEDKGYQRSADSIARLTITYIAESVTKTDVEQLGPLGQQPTTDPVQSNNARTWSRNYNQNSLVIEVTDAVTKKIIWRATTNFEGTSLTDARTLNSVVFRIFKKFPRSSKKKRK